MEFKNNNLKLIREALSYGLVNSRSESETAAFALLLLDVEKGIRKEIEAEVKKHELKGCPFKYCDSSPECEGKCRYA